MVFSLDEVREFDARMREAGLAPQYVVEAKIDGLSISLEYRNGVLFGAPPGATALWGKT